MRTLALACAFLLALVLPAGASTATAGGWAVTYLDPVPSSFQPSVTHTVGYWVLQHGTHPFAGDLDATGLRFRSGTTDRFFPGVTLGQPAHYVTTFALPEGVYEVFGVQGVFPDHPIGTLTVPGALSPAPLDPELRQGDLATGVWEEIAPPAGVPAAPEPRAVSEPTSRPVPVWVVALLVAGAAGVFVAVRRRLVRK